jgi:cytochrome c oxidase subunit IV
MSATGTQPNAAAEAHGDEASHSGHHPTPAEYVRIALILGVLTALEVSTYYVEFGRAAIPLLVVLMVVKFVMVAGFFMHLRYDTRLFSKFMYTGLGFALVLYTATLLIFAVDASQ